MIDEDVSTPVFFPKRHQGKASQVGKVKMLLDEDRVWIPIGYIVVDDGEAALAVIQVMRTMQLRDQSSILDSLAVQNSQHGLAGHFQPSKTPGGPHHVEREWLEEVGI
jgi:hypothetical protein